MQVELKINVSKTIYIELKGGNKQVEKKLKVKFQNLKGI